MSSDSSEDIIAVTDQFVSFVGIADPVQTQSDLTMDLVGTNQVFSDYQTAVKYVRDQAVKRVNNIDILVTESVYNQLDLGEMEEGCQDILAHTGNPKEGDYINGSLVGNSATGEKQQDGNWLIHYYFAYWDTAQEEQEIDAVVSSLVASLSAPVFVFTNCTWVCKWYYRSSCWFLLAVYKPFTISFFRYLQTD